MSHAYYHIESFGCQMNLSDSERIAGQLEILGFSAAETRDRADILVINTCCVRESAENRIFGHIGALKKLKEKNPDVLVIVAGCLAQKDQQAIFRRAPHVDVVLGTQNIDRLSSIITAHRSRDHRLESAPCLTDGLGEDQPLRRHKGVSAWIPVMYGCDNFCSYCIVPYVRGRERSRNPEAILQEIRQFAGSGGQEVTLLGQNVNSYGRNLEGTWDFPGLLTAVDEQTGIRRIRFMTSHPKDFSDALIRAMADGNSVCRHLHLPVQSGCDEILKRMNRHYTSEGYARHIENVRKAIPDISITTDIIVGFPGETEEMFGQTLRFMEDIRFDAAFTFLYSKRSGTPAAAMEQQIEPSLKQERLQRLMDLQNGISLSINRKWVGRTVEVLSDGPSKTDPEVYSGRTSQNKLVLWPVSTEDRPGRFLQVRIDSAQSFLLKGSEVSAKVGMQP